MSSAPLIFQFIDSHLSRVQYNGTVEGALSSENAKAYNVARWLCCPAVGDDRKRLPGQWFELEGISPQLLNLYCNRYLREHRLTSGRQITLPKSSLSAILMDKGWQLEKEGAPPLPEELPALHIAIMIELFKIMEFQFDDLHSWFSSSPSDLKTAKRIKTAFESTPWDETKSVWLRETASLLKVGAPIAPPTWSKESRRQIWLARFATNPDRTRLELIEEAFILRPFIDFKEIPQREEEANLFWKLAPEEIGSLHLSEKTVQFLNHFTPVTSGTIAIAERLFPFSL